METALITLCVGGGMGVATIIERVAETELMADFHCSIDADGVATITWDVPGRTMNLMRMEGFTELGNLVDAAMFNDDVRGIVITSGKESFSGGMELSGFEELNRLGRGEITRCRA